MGQQRPRKLIGDLLVGIAGGNQAQHANFARGESIVGSVLRKFIGSFGREHFLSGVHGTNCVKQFLMQTDRPYP